MAGLAKRALSSAARAASLPARVIVLRKQARGVVHAKAKVFQTMTPGASSSS